MSAAFNPQSSGAHAALRRTVSALGDDGSSLLRGPLGRELARIGPISDGLAPFGVGIALAEIEGREKCSRSSKEFAMRGNVVDLAVGVIIGAAFGGIVNSLVGDIIMPIIGAVTGGLDFSNHFIPLSKSVTSPVLSEAKKQGAVTGNFLRAALQGATAPRLPSFRDTLRRVVDLFSAAVQARAFSTDLAQYSNVTAEPGRVLWSLRSVVG